MLITWAMVLSIVSVHANSYLLAKSYVNGSSIRTTRVQSSSIYIVQAAPFSQLLGHQFRAYIANNTDPNGCDNTNTKLPGGQDYMLLFNNGGCILETKADNAKSMGAKALMVFRELDSKSEGSMEPQNRLSIPAIYVDEIAGSDLRMSYEALVNTTGETYLEITVELDNDNTPGLWEFTLIVVVVLLAISFTTSVVMHCHLYRLRRRRLTEQRNAQMELARRSRISVLSSSALEAIPAQKYKSRASVNVNSANEEAKSETAPQVDGLSAQAERDSIITRRPNEDEDEAISCSNFGTLPTRRNSVESQRDVCAICIEDFVEDDEFRELPCLHRFHVDCIDPWLTTKNAVCPLCKLSLVPKEEVENPMEVQQQPEQEEPHEISAFERLFGAYRDRQRTPDVEANRTELHTEQSSRFHWFR